MLTVTRRMYPSKAAERLYLETFPYDERRTVAGHVRTAAGEPEFHACELSRKQDGAFAGILYYWLWPEDNLCYTEHLAVEASLRGCGIGHAALEYLIQLKCCIILEIEPVVDALTARRRAFYLSAGFVPLDYEHVQLPYHADSQPVALELLSRQPSGEPAARELVERLEQRLRHQVMLPRE